MVYEWGLLVFCKQTPFQLAAIGTLTVILDFVPEIKKSIVGISSG